MLSSSISDIIVQYSKKETSMKQKIIALLLTFSSLLTFASSVVHAEDKATPVKSKYVISSDSSFAPFVFQDNNNQ